ncbi:hypothetical protein HZB08_01055, partial [Candidatus Saganbacteria bacterium]|nr:hypothetical protein [Candidatus Saganbacteria bacterium]
MGEFTTEGGGVHPGKPIIWPTGKPTSTPVGSTSEAETAGGVRGVPPRTTPTRPGEVVPTEGVTPQVPAALPAKPTPSITRPLTVEDLRSHLLSLQIEPNDFNTKLASLMLRNGLEITRMNFVKLAGMLSGTNKSPAMQEAALLLLMKGIDSPAAVKILGQYLSENPALAPQMLALQEGMKNLISAMAMGKGLLNSMLVSQITALLSQFDETFQRVQGKFSDKSFAARGSTINDVRALKALLEGLEGKTPPSDSPEAQVLSSALMEFQGKLDSVMQNLLAQAILSQSGRSEVNYHYQQIPNAMTKPPKDFEIVIKRDGEGKDAVIDPRHTQVVMSMDTENMGKMVVSIIVKDNKVYVIFVFAEKDYGDQGRSLIAREFGEFQQKLSDKNFLITGYQVKVDPAM